MESQSYRIKQTSVILSKISEPEGFYVSFVKTEQFTKHYSNLVITLKAET